MKKERLIKDYRELDKELAGFYYRINSKRQYEKKIFIPDFDKKNDLEKELDGLLKKVEQINAPDNVFGIIKDHYYDFFQGQNLKTKKIFERPSEHINIFVNTFQDAVRRDSRPDKIKAEIITTRFQKADEIWDAIKNWIENVSSDYMRELIDSCKLYITTMREEVKKLNIYFPNLSNDELNNLKNVIEALSFKMNEWIIYAKKELMKIDDSKSSDISDDDVIKFDESYYRLLLNNNFGINLDEILEWHESEVEKTRNEVFEIASRLKIADPIPKTMKEVNDILLKYAGPYENPEEMYKVAEVYLKRARAACHEFMYLPEDESCIITETPEQYKFSWPWGGCGGGCPIRRPLIGEIFYNRNNYKAVTDGWIKMCSLHEAYPGHHAQFVRATLDPIPETMKIGAKHIPLMEGTAHRSERAFEFVFGEDQFYPLFVAYRRHHTSVRIKADLWLRYFGRPIKDAVDLYIKELDFDRHIARGQVKQQENMQGYFNCYYFGMKKLSDWENKYKISKKDFTELLFSLGRVSLDTFHRFIKLNEIDKYRLTNDFGSLME